jgi:LPS-assembly lipoprotein
MGRTAEARVKAAARFAAIGAATLLLAACFRPLYGSAELGGAAAQDVLAAIEVPQIDDRTGHYLRNELAFGLNGSGAADAPKRFRLLIDVTETVGTAIIDRVTGTAEVASLTIEANYRLMPMSGGTAPVTSGIARTNVAYQRTSQRFATVRAARDAQIRGAKQLAEEIRNRIALHFAASGGR